MKFKTLLTEVLDQHILLVTFNRPECRNAINFEMMQDFLMLWKMIQKEEHSIRCVILTGQEKAFCAGADLKERKNMSLDIWQQQRVVLQDAMYAMIDCPIPIIAAVNGAAFGGGLEITLASDFAYASETAVFSQSEVKIGIMPGALGTQNLPRACGVRRAKELTFTGQTFSAKEAFDWGVINRICDPNYLLDEVKETANAICENAPLAIKEVKQALNMSQQLDIKSGFAFEVGAYNRLLTTRDREEGILAFNEKRKPVFEGK